MANPETWSRTMPLADEHGADEHGVEELFRTRYLELAGLPARRREAIVLRYWLDLPEREIAVAMGVSPGTVKSHVSRGMAELTLALKSVRAQEEQA
jgi:RNA polymerase sigma factor (sigma-70 family)